MFFGLILILLIGGEMYTAANIIPDADTNAARVQFIKALGLNPDETATAVKEIIIPENFSDVYNNYNKLQLQAGYDLSLYKGCNATLYTHSIETPSGYSGNCVVNIIVYNDRIIGGDISSAELDGFMLPLCKIS